MVFRTILFVFLIFHISTRLGWCNIGDEELLILSDAIRVKKTLKELWMEGNRVSSEGLLLLSDLTPSPLTKVVTIWNNVSNTVPDSMCSAVSTQKNITVDFTDDDVWDGWGEWVLRRCEVSSNEKLLMVLHKVCNVSVPCLETQWAKIFYRNLLQLVQNRIELCTEDDMCKKLKKFQNILTS